MKIFLAQGHKPWNSSLVSHLTLSQWLEPIHSSNFLLVLRGWCFPGADTYFIRSICSSDLFATSDLSAIHVHLVTAERQQAEGPRLCRRAQPASFTTRARCSAPSHLPEMANSHYCHTWLWKEKHYGKPPHSVVSPMPGTQNASYKLCFKHTTCWEPTVTQSGSKQRLPTWKEELKADGCICINSGQYKSVFLGKVWKESWLSMGKDH